MFRILRDYLVLEGLKYSLSPHNQRIMNALYKTSYESRDDQAFSIHQLRLLKNAVTPEDRNIPIKRTFDEWDD